MDAATSIAVPEEDRINIELDMKSIKVSPDPNMYPDDFMYGQDINDSERLILSTLQAILMSWFVFAPFRTILVITFNVYTKGISSKKMAVYFERALHALKNHKIFTESVRKQVSNNLRNKKLVPEPAATDETSDGSDGSSRLTSDGSTAELISTVSERTGRIQREVDKEIRAKLAQKLSGPRYDMHAKQIISANTNHTSRNSPSNSISNSTPINEVWNSTRQDDPKPQRSSSQREYKGPSWVPSQKLYRGKGKIEEGEMSAAQKQEMKRLFEQRQRFAGMQRSLTNRSSARREARAAARAACGLPSLKTRSKTDPPYNMVRPKPQPNLIKASTQPNLLIKPNLSVRVPMTPLPPALALNIASTVFPAVDSSSDSSSEASQM